MFDITSFILGLQKGKIMGGASGGGATETDIIPLQDAPFTQNTQGIYEWYLTPAPTALKAGETYHVKWGEQEYTLTAVDASAIMSGGVALGNLGIYGMTDTGEPFLFAYVPNYGGTGVATLGCLTLETDAIRSVRIYQKASSNDSSDGTNSNLLLTSGTVTVTDESASYTVLHEHGKVPDIVIITGGIAPSISTVQSYGYNLYLGGVQYSRAMVDAINAGKKDKETKSIGAGLVCVFGASIFMFAQPNHSIDDEDPWSLDNFGCVRNCNKNTFTLGGGSIAKLYRPTMDGAIVDNDYTWYAISGLT